MDTYTPMNQPPPSPMPPMPQGMGAPLKPAPGKDRSGLLWALIVLVAFAIVAVVGWYLYDTYLGAPRSPGGAEAPLATPPAPDAATQALEAQGNTDDVGSIEADLNATDLNSLDRELGDIDAALQ